MPACYTLIHVSLYTVLLCLKAFHYSSNLLYNATFKRCKEYLSQGKSSLICLFSQEHNHNLYVSIAAFRWVLIYFPHIRQELLHESWIVSIHWFHSTIKLFFNLGMLCAHHAHSEAHIYINTQLEYKYVGNIKVRTVYKWLQTG